MGSIEQNYEDLEKSIFIVLKRFKERIDRVGMKTGGTDDCFEYSFFCEIENIKDR